MPKVSTPRSYKEALGKVARHHVLYDIIWRSFGAAGIPAVKDPSGVWTRQTRWQTSRRANLNPMAWWPFVSLGRYSRQRISWFLHWQSSHRHWCRQGGPREPRPSQWPGKKTFFVKIEGLSSFTWHYLHFFYKIRVKILKLLQFPVHLIIHDN